MASHDMATTGKFDSRHWSGSPVAFDRSTDRDMQGAYPDIGSQTPTLGFLLVSLGKTKVLPRILKDAR